MKESILPINKWSPSWTGVFCIYLGLTDHLKDKDPHMQIFFLILAVYLIIMRSTIFESTTGRKMTLEDIRERKVLEKQPKSMVLRIVREVVFFITFSLLFSICVSIDPDGILTYLLVWYIMHCALKLCGTTKETTDRLTINT